LMDVVPTLMYAIGLPVARDLDGRVLSNAFDKRFVAQHPLNFMPTYEGLMERPVAAKP
jgi:arylsulfatase A-like enzyme